MTDSLLPEIPIGHHWYAELTGGRLIGLTKLAYADQKLLSMQLGEPVRRCFRTAHDVPAIWMSAAPELVAPLRCFST
jgi:hypothetical protein